MAAAAGHEQKHELPAVHTPSYGIIKPAFDADIVEQLKELIRIPNQSPMFDSQNLHVDRLLQLITRWIDAQHVEGLTYEILHEEKRTSLIYCCVQPKGKFNENDVNVLMYGHFDKQPPLTESWTTGAPYDPLIKDGFLYGRGGADDGYAVFAAIAAIKALQTQGHAHAKYHIVIEGCEESGSPDLAHYIEQLRPRLGKIDMIVCLDSGAADYNRLWLTTSLRGLVVGNLKVQLLNEGVHSGMSSGIVPDSFRVARHLLDRLEDTNTGDIKPQAFYAQPIPEYRIAEAKQQASILGHQVHGEFPFVQGAKPVHTDPHELILNQTWRPALTVTGADGLPPIAAAGNVNRPFTALKLSMRIPPHVDGPTAGRAFKALFETDPPYGATVTCDVVNAKAGFDAPALAPWLETAVRNASQTYWGQPYACAGEGGSIPFMNFLQSIYPQAQFIVTGVLGPHSNAHGPNECLNLEYCCRLICSVSDILAAHADAKKQS